MRYIPETESRARTVDGLDTFKDHKQPHVTPLGPLGPLHLALIARSAKQSTQPS